jgi:phage baseplate assembly protein gpV
MPPSFFIPVPICSPLRAVIVDDGEIPANAMRYDDGTVMRYDDGTIMTYDA